MVGVGLAATILACARYAPEVSDRPDDFPEMSAARLGDADAPETAPVDAAAGLEERYLTPAEREALASQGYEPSIDDHVVTQTRIEPARKDAPKGPVGRAMDHLGKGFVAVASVALVVGAAVAPFFLF